MRTTGIISICDLVITVAYFSIPLQLIVSIWKSPPHRKIPRQLILTLLLFAAFIFLCGSGHLMRYLGMGTTHAFVIVNVATAVVSLATALYLVPLIPCMFSLLDESINKLTNETKESKSKLINFMAFLCHEIRYGILTDTLPSGRILENCICWLARSRAPQVPRISQCVSFFSLPFLAIISGIHFLPLLVALSS